MAHALPPPDADAQLEFLNQLQRLFAEGDFVATYKFSLLIALADLAVELGGDNGNGLELSLRQIARRFIQNYWFQALPTAPANHTSRRVYCTKTWVNSKQR